ncbi:MAG: ATP-binding protein [bacterium]|jgi:predicted AAA+ superfamily ATPase|nr:ATP-binding protein [candidate division KSB1 bacterium]MDH7561478.1 ATP-binding protein [bacterium]
MRWQDTSSIRARLAQMLSDSLVAPLPAATPRRVHTRVWLPGKATAVIGMRRAGKTTFLHQLRRERMEQGVPRERLPYINFEDERLAGIEASRLHTLVEEYYRLFPAFRGRETVSWFLDEIHTVPGWERFVRRLIDTEKVEICVSGSSAALLSREVATSMRGRGWEVVIYPFSFAEYLCHHQRPVPSRLDLLSSVERSELDHALRDYLRVGGFPEAQGLDEPERFALLQQYVDLAVLRGVMERRGLTQVVALRWLVRHLLGNPGGSFSAEKFYRDLKSQGIAVSRDTLHQMVSSLEDCFLVRICWLDTASERRRMVNPRKVYPVDMGLIPVFDRMGKANVGHALETAVRIELERWGMEVSYVRTATGEEVDFVARRPGAKPHLIQVCAELASADTVQREVQALQAAAAEYPGASLHLVTLTTDALPELPAHVQVHSAALWLLGEMLG